MTTHEEDPDFYDYEWIIDQIIEAVVTSVPGMVVYEPGSPAPTPPAFLVQQPEPAVTYQRRFETTEGEYQFEILVLMPAAEPRHSKRRIARLISPDSDLIAAIHDIRDDQGNGLLDVVSAIVGDAEIGGGKFPSALISITGSA